MSDKSLKVTDRRMFTPDGELREEFSHLREVPAGAASPSSPSDDPAPSAARPAPAESRQAGPRQAEPRQAEPRQAEPRQAGPGFFDLIGLLAEPASHYMREARTAPPQEASQSLALARLHIDLLTVLEDKTRGNLTPEEKAMLDDVVHQLRSGFVGLGG